MVRPRGGSVDRDDFRQFAEGFYPVAGRREVMCFGELVVHDCTVDPGRHGRLQSAGGILHHQRLLRGVAEAMQGGQTWFRVRLGEPIVLTHQHEIHELPDLALFVDELEIRAFGRRHDRYADMLRQLGKSLDDAFDLEGFGLQVFLIISVTNRALAGRQWGARCRTLKDPSHGRWYYWVKVTDAQGLRRRVRRGSFESEQAAIAARDAAVTEPSPRVLAQAWTVQKWLLDWLEQVQVRPSTLRGYMTIVHCHLIPALGSTRLSELGTAQVQQAMDAIARKPARRGGTLIPSTVAGVLAVLRSALGLARARGYVRFNAAVGVLKPRCTRVTGVVWTPERIAVWRQTGQRPSVAVWNPDGAAIFLDAVADDPLLPLWQLATLCGLRRGEIAGLRGDDFDFVNGQVQVTKQLHVNGSRRWIGPPKSAAGTRVVPLDDVTNDFAEGTGSRRLPIGAGRRRTRTGRCSSSRTAVR